MEDETAPHNEALALAIGTFVNRPTSLRMLSLASVPKSRRKLVAMLADFSDFKPDTILPTKSDAEVRKAVGDYVRQHPDATAFHVVSENPRLDERDLPVDLLLDELFTSGFGTFAWLDPTHFAVYGGEDANSRVVLRA